MRPATRREAVHDRAHDPAASLRTSRRKVGKFSPRTAAGEGTGRDGLDAPADAARRLRASVEMEAERALGRQLERHGTWGLVRPRCVAAALLFHSIDDTGRTRSAR